MPASGARLLFALFIFWLLVRDAKRRETKSLALWVPVLWVTIVGSRPLSLWFNTGAQTASDFQEGNPLDRMIFLALIATAMMVIIRRRVDLRSFMAQNRALCCLCVFWALSVMWADNSFIALKRWVKDMGNVVMVLAILSEKNPIEAIKMVFTRAAYFLVPGSVLLIKWYPALGSYYNRWTGSSFCQGVTTNKNLLGITLTVCTLFVVWEFLQMRERKPGLAKKIDMMNMGLLILMAGWLFRKANSATSLACTFFGIMALVAFNLASLKRVRGQLVGYIIAAAVVLLVLSSVFDLGALGAGMLGRDTSLHGRTEIWSLALAEKSNPLIGAGFYSFWSEARATRFMEVYSFVLTQAHNGYLETYLNGGFIALALLFATIVAGGKTIQNRLITNVEWGSISLVFWLIILAHNWSEASFNKLTLLWFVFLMVSIRYPIGARAPLTQQQRTVRLGPQAVLRPNTSGIQ